MAVANKIRAAIEARKEEIWSQFPEQEYVNEDFVCLLAELEEALLDQALLNLKHLDEGDLRAILTSVAGCNRASNLGAQYPVGLFALKCRAKTSSWPSSKGLP